MHGPAGPGRPTPRTVYLHPLWQGRMHGPAGPGRAAPRTVYLHPLWQGRMHGPAGPGRAAAGGTSRQSSRPSHRQLILAGKGAQMRVLIVEDEVKMASLIRRGLRADGMAADVAVRGEDALWMAASTTYDAIVLDVMLPGIDGFDVCQRLREDGIWAPVLMLTARDSIGDRVAGLDNGADDYLVKPFSFAELGARLRALVRRGPVERPAVLHVGDLTLDPATKRVTRGDEDIALSAKEFALLDVFMRRPGEVLDRFLLLERAWDNDYENRSNVVDVYVRYLREKIDRPFGVQSIETVRGSGYRMRPDGGSP